MKQAIGFRSKLFTMILLVTLNVGCAGFGKKLKAFLNGQQTSGSSMDARKSVTSFKNTPSFMKGPQRRYKRTTKKKMAQESLLNARSGSLWIMEGQGSYLFAQNIMRLIGDSIAVTLDGEPRDQLQSKVNVIGDLYKQLIERRRAKRRLASRAKKSGKKKKGEKAKPKPADKGGAVANKVAESTPLSVKIVPSRIIERLQDGNYRVKGSQTFLIGPHQYRVIVTGIVRSEEFSEDGISATRLLDSRFDIVSVKKNQKKM